MGLDFFFTLSQVYYEKWKAKQNHKYTQTQCFVAAFFSIFLLKVGIFRMHNVRIQCTVHFEWSVCVCFVGKRNEMENAWKKARWKSMQRTLKIEFVVTTLHLGLCLRKNCIYFVRICNLRAITCLVFFFLSNQLFNGLRITQRYLIYVCVGGFFRGGGGGGGVRYYCCCLVLCFRMKINFVRIGSNNSMRCILTWFVASSFLPYQMCRNKFKLSTLTAYICICFAAVV